MQKPAGDVGHRRVDFHLPDMDEDAGTRLGLETGTGFGGHCISSGSAVVYLWRVGGGPAVERVGWRSSFRRSRTSANSHFVILYGIPYLRSPMTAMNAPILNPDADIVEWHIVALCQA
jgi:hypothetical protein